MNFLTRILFPLVSYVCVATVLSTILGYGYLRSKGKFDDEQLLQLVALFHEVDLNEIAEENSQDVGQVPEEELSYEDRQAQQELLMRQFEAKQEDLQSNLNRFRYVMKEVKSATQRYEEVRTDVRIYLEEQNKKVMKEGPARVRTQLENIDPNKQAKPILLDMVEKGRMDEVVMLLESMKGRSQKDILKSFTSEKELEILYQIQTHIMSGKPTKPKIDEAIEALEQLNEQENK